jgi:membrane protein implicated in regulation of membrane protease activity
MPSNDDKRLSVVLLAGAALAVALVAALAAWTAQLGGGAWALVLVPFGLVLAVLLVTLVWPRVAGNGDDQQRQAPARPGHRRALPIDQQPASHAPPRAA